MPKGYGKPTKKPTKKKVVAKKPKIGYNKSRKVAGSGKTTIRTLKKIAKNKYGKA